MEFFGKFLVLIITGLCPVLWHLGICGIATCRFMVPAKSYCSGGAQGSLFIGRMCYIPVCTCQPYLCTMGNPAISRKVLSLLKNLACFLPPANR